MNIILERNHQTLEYAASELKKYVRMMMPMTKEPHIMHEDSTSGKKLNGIRIGFMSDFGLDTSDAEDIALDDIIYIDMKGEEGIIAGTNPIATLIAVYRYLKACGCRWLFPGKDGEWIPIIESLPDVQYRKLADYRYRGQCNEGGEYEEDMMAAIEFTPKIGMNSFMLEFLCPRGYYDRYYQHQGSTCRETEPVTYDTVLQWKRECEAEIALRGLHFHDMGHGWTAEPFGLNSSKGWDSGDGKEPAEVENAREYLAEVKGHRGLIQNAPLVTNVCMSNPKVRSIMAKAVADHAERTTNVDFLHVWLSDGNNVHCECAECRKKTPTDWYIQLMNEIDDELVARNLNTHIVFISYFDTIWAPLTERLKNQNRFTMLFAPVHRTYEETYEKDADPSAVVPFKLNQNEPPKGMAKYLGFLEEWQKVFQGDAFCYEYHFWRHQTYDLSGLYLAELLSHDVKGLKLHQLKGFIEDGSQRSAFPNGLPFYVYAETLFDREASFEELRDDYFKFAYGEDWQLALNYLEVIKENLPFGYLSGARSTDAEKGLYYNPNMVEKFALAKKAAEEFLPVAKAHRIQEKRATCVAWKLLAFEAEIIPYYADILSKVCTGKREEVQNLAKELQDLLSYREYEFEKWFDLSLYHRYTFPFIFEGTDIF